jgi:folate-dependent phosphoribosylglycinamide formyltransferase PurN
MKITLFTANQRRHNFFINQLSSICDELYVIQENRTIFPGIFEGHYLKSETIENYFKNVIKAEINIFEDAYIFGKNKNINLLPIANKDLNNIELKSISSFLKSDIYIVFGSSYIKGDLINFLINYKAINIHMGISPYYRGTDCNFWALYDNNPHLVGATIHLLSKGIDSGEILYHAISDIKKNPFEYTMSTVKSAFLSLVQRIKDKTIFKIKTQKQDRSKEIKYTKSSDFNENVVEKFLKTKVDINSKKFDLSLLKDPYILK